MPEDGGLWSGISPRVAIGGEEYQTFWEGFCARLNGTADMTSPMRFLDNYGGLPSWALRGFNNIISLPKGSKRLFKKWCTAGPSYLDPSNANPPGVDFGTGQPKWTDFLERSTPQACKEWYGKYITEDNWNFAPGTPPGGFTPIIPTMDAAFDAVVCTAQTRPLWRESNRVPNGSCQGDSGGPLVEGTLNSLGAQYGVVSYAGPRTYKKKSRLGQTLACAGLQSVCRCGGKVVQCTDVCPKEMSVGWRHVDQFPTVYAKVSHFKEWLKQQESVCGKMRWSSDV